MANYIIEKRNMFNKDYLKVMLKDNTHLATIQKLLQEIQSISKVNITDNKRTDITIYPSEFYSAEETEEEVKIQLESFYTSQPLDPIFEADLLSKISSKAYDQIINEINVFGLNLEKYKSLYSKFDEEGFRDFFLPHLNSISRNHTATGETFNKIGKTDMLIQDSIGQNVFIAECKIWYGEKELLKAVDQLLERYVTWRDEQVALIIFNKHNAGFTSILEKSKEAMKTHSGYSSLVKENTQTSVSYLFMNADDNKKKIKIELMIFNCS
ncbi:hypothetical protein M3I01_017195 [Marinomonas sp. RSW2]|uniref:Restriction endonuclease type IV Mrr domain-containing protein n=1 Tax=Marinomonas maritima TaxID=2940935 RepID=A0ABT5WIE9_9GAMM|nr:hypothetical protein [Marinomonas maritima]MDE8604597.1 hypothetical protein [Marinomonas maritima]